MSTEDTKQVDPLAELIKILDIGNPNDRAGLGLARVAACEAILKFGGKHFVRQPGVRDKVRDALSELVTTGPDTTCRVRAAIAMLEHEGTLGNTRVA